ncbi:nuclear transport factor 2 family protein [Rhodopseudomonas sp.]|uniref:nuclear transport factor 2 family protein n=1 Tax=Rhodopseudomonas sp. TaxID=1078 RepID=UPI003B3AA1FE
MIAVRRRGLPGASARLQFAPFQIVAQRVAQPGLPPGGIRRSWRGIAHVRPRPPTAMVAVVIVSGLVCIDAPDPESRMLNDTYALTAASQQTVAIWHRALPAADAVALTGLLAEDVIFHSPAVQSPIQGREATLLVMLAVAEVLENIRYRRTFIGGPCEAALEFSAEIGKLQVKGVDLMRLDGDGKILEFEVMMRPLRTLSAVADAVGSRVAPKMLQLKLKPG